MFRHDNLSPSKDVQTGRRSVLNYLVGVAGWNDPSWRHLLDLHAQSHSDRVLMSMQHLVDFVEISSSHYHPLDSRTIMAWLKKLDPGLDFRFSVRLWQKFVREQPAASSPSDIALFTKMLAPLKSEGRLAAVVAQFPATFRSTLNNVDWLFSLLDVFHEYPMVVEINHPSWQRAELATRLGACKGVLALVDRPSAPLSAVAHHNLHVSASYIRCDGRNQQHWHTSGENRRSRFDYLYAADELDEIASEVKKIARKSLFSLVVFNNSPHGHALVNAYQFRQLLGGEMPAIPPRLAERVGMRVRA